MSLQKPVVRPSMIGRGSASNRSVATIDVAGLAGRRLGESDRRVLGVGEAADRADLGGEGGRVSEHGVGGREVGLARRLVDDHHVPGDVAGGEDVRRRRAKLGVHLDVAARVGLGRRRRGG